MPVTNRIVTTSVSFQGSLYSSVTYSDTADTLGIQFVKFELLSLSENAAPMEESWSAGWQSDPTPAAFALCPHWFAASVVTLIAATPWLRFQFSLRTLLIATTLVAVVLGLVVWASR
jgi:hypothetical protein